MSTDSDQSTPNLGPPRTSTPNLKLPYLMPAQALKYLTHNEALQALDVRVQTQVQSRTLAVTPSSPEDGHAYIIPDPVGDWAYTAGTLVVQHNGGFVVYPAYAGWLVYIVDEGVYAHYDGTNWQTLETEVSSPFLTLGVNATADATNRLSVSSEACLLTHAGTDHRVVINKASLSDTASVVFQTNYSGRAEFGLTGSDDFALKVSPDGTNFTDVFTISPATGNMNFFEGQALEFAVTTSNISGIHSVGVFQDNFHFKKLSSDVKRTEGSAYVFERCGAAAIASPFEQGMILTASNLLHSNAPYYPKASLFWSYATKNDPTDTSFNIQPDLGGQKTDFSMFTDGGGAFKMIGTGGMYVGDVARAPLATLDVEGTLRLKSYLIADLPSGAGVGVGSLACVSNATGGMSLAFFDGTNWRGSHDRSIVS